MSVENVAYYKSINDKLDDYDWFVSPYYSRLQLDPLSDYLEHECLPTCKREKEAAGRKIAGFLMTANLDVRFRAATIYECYRVAPSARRFSHLIEAGLFEFYRFNFITCLAVWVPVVEGVMKSLLNRGTGRKPSASEIGSLTAKDASLQPFLSAVLHTIRPYLFDKFFGQYTDDGTAPAHNLNRHLFVHLSSNVPSYCRSNCIRLINVLDSLLFIDLVTSGMYQPLLGGTSECVKERVRYYEFLLDSAFTDGEATRVRLLKDHPDFNADFYYDG